MQSQAYPSPTNPSTHPALHFAILPTRPNCLDIQYTGKMHILPLALTLVATYLAIPALSHNCPYPRLAKAYCCKTTAMTIVQPHPEQDLGIHLGEDCRVPFLSFSFLFWRRFGRCSCADNLFSQARRQTTPITSNARTWVQRGDGNRFVGLRR